MREKDWNSLEQSFFFFINKRFVFGGLSACSCVSFYPQAVAREKRSKFPVLFKSPEKQAGCRSPLAVSPSPKPRPLCFTCCGSCKNWGRETLKYGRQTFAGFLGLFAEQKTCDSACILSRPPSRAFFSGKPIL